MCRSLLQIAAINKLKLTLTFSPVQFNCYILVVQRSFDRNFCFSLILLHLILSGREVSDWIYLFSLSIPAKLYILEQPKLWNVKTPNNKLSIHHFFSHRLKTNTQNEQTNVEKRDDAAKTTEKKQTNIRVCLSVVCT